MAKDDPTDLTEAQSHGPTRRQSTLLDRILRRDTSPAPAEEEHNARAESLPPLSDIHLTGYLRTTKHKLLDDELARNIRGLLPPRLQLYEEWELLYSSEQHGISLSTLYRNCSMEHQERKQREAKTGKKLELGYADGIVRGMIQFGEPDRPNGARPHGYVIILRDQNKNKFGCYLNEPPRASDHKRYYGNGECFLWKCERYIDDHSTPKKPAQRFKAFMYTGLNDNIIYLTHSYIAVGSSHGQNGLWIDGELNLGVSYPCETFGNEVLSEYLNSAHKFGRFSISDLEVWRVGAL